MATTTNKTIVIDEEATAESLIRNYVEGNKKDVYAALTQDHCGLLALFLLEGIRSKRLKSQDVNAIVNKLIDDRQELYLDTVSVARK